MASRPLNQPPKDTVQSPTHSTNSALAASLGRTNQKRDGPNYLEKFESLRKADKGTLGPSNEELEGEVFRTKNPRTNASITKHGRTV
jgi:hypothetical protein